jgi:hypothetical protein
MNWLTKFIPGVLRRRRLTPIAAYVEPCGVWGIHDTVAKKSEVCGVLYSANIIAENENGRLVMRSEWVPGPDLRREKLSDSPSIALPP